MNATVNAAWAVLLTALTAAWTVQTRPAAERLAVVPVALGLAVVILLRHRRPGPMLLLALAVGALQLLLDVPVNPLSLALVLVVFTNAALREGWASRLAMAVALAAPPIAAVRWPPAPDFDEALADTFLGTLVLVMAWVLGYSVRTRRAYRAELAERAARLERERQALAREREALAAAAVAAERSRIVREVHDVVAHDVSAMVVQADGAAHVLDTDPGQVRTALGTIAETGRQALAELRRLVTVLCGTSDAAEPGAYAPQPGVAELPDLVAEARGAGMDVDLRVEGAPRPLPSGVQLTVYHLVREALRNSRQHAGPRAGAQVRLQYAEDELVVLVEDDGVPADADRPAGPGRRERPDHGLLRMRERVRTVGGSMVAGPRPGGGFRVSAVLPVRHDACRDAARDAVPGALRGRGGPREAGRRAVAAPGAGRPCATEGGEEETGPHP